MISNHLPPKEKTSYCVGYPVFYNGKPAHIISYKSVCIGGGLFEINFVKLCFKKTVVEKGKSIATGIIMKCIDIENITLRLI